MPKSIYKKQKGQALLVVLIVGTLTLLVLLGIASRLGSSQANIRKSNEFDKSVALSENKIQDIVASFNTNKAQACLSKLDAIAGTDYINLRTINTDGSCSFLVNDSNIDVFSKLSSDPSVNVQFSKPTSLFLGLNASVVVENRTVELDCQVDTNSSGQPDKFVVTRVYVDSSGEYKVDKGIFLCNQPSNVVTFYDANGADVSSQVRSDTKLIRVRMLDGSSGNNSVSIVAKDNSGTVTGTSQKYEFMIVGAGGQGSDSIVKFEKSKDPETPLAFDFVYFGEDM